MKANTLFALVIIAVAPLLHFFSNYIFSVYHLFVEIVMMIMGVLIFVLSMISYRLLKDRQDYHIGYGFPAIVLLTFVYLIIRQQIVDVPGAYGNIASQIRLAMDSILAINILVSIIHQKSQRKFPYLVAFYLVSGIAMLVLIFMRIFPLCYIEGVGSTPFRIASNVVVILLHMTSLVLLLMKRQRSDAAEYRALPYALGFIIVSVILMELQMDEARYIVAVAYYSRLIGFILILVSVINRGIRQPYSHALHGMAQYQTQLENQLHQFQLVFEDAPLGYHMLDGSGHICQANAAWFALLQYEPSQVIGTAFASYLPPEDAALYMEHFDRMKSSEVFQMNLRVRTRQGRLLNVRYSCRSVHEETDEWQIYGVLEDITEQITLDQLLHDSEERYRTIFQQAQFGICSISVDGRFVGVNPKLTEVMGYSMDELIDMEVQDLVHPDDVNHVLDLVQKLLKGKVPNMALNIRCFDRHQRIHYLETMSSVIQGTVHREPFILSVIKDVTSLRELEQKSMNLESHLRNQQKLDAIGTLAGGVAHEINNPINGIMNYSQLIYDDAEEGSSTQTFAKEIVHETERVATIVKNLLHFSRQQEQSYSMKNMKDVLDATLSLIQTVIKNDQIQLDVHVPHDLPYIMCHSQQIEQVIMNLITNGRDALNEKYPEYDERKRLTISCYEHTMDQKTCLRLTVEDRGNGVPAEIQERIYDPFFTTKNRDKGTGIGLAISYGIVKEHGGMLSFETQPGEFTRFHMDLPVIED